MNKIKILIPFATALVVSCSTLVPAAQAVSFNIPKLEVVRPTRPTLEESLTEEALKGNLVVLMGYALKLESYADIMEKYIKELEGLQ